MVVWGQARVTSWPAFWIGQVAVNRRGEQFKFGIDVSQATVVPCTFFALRMGQANYPMGLNPPPRWTPRSATTADVALRIQHFGARLSSSDLRDDYTYDPLNFDRSVDRRINADLHLENAHRLLGSISNGLSIEPAVDLI
jgi:hypothetical protein